VVGRDSILAAHALASRDMPIDGGALDAGKPDVFVRALSPGAAEALRASALLFARRATDCGRHLRRVAPLRLGRAAMPDARAGRALAAP
jgi:carbonic anhydrase/acetyltransferase-like protein (isoleucine patch superfamily)